MNYGFLLDIAIILISTKIFGLFSGKFHMPQVVGALVAGLLFGPAFLNIISSSQVTSSLAELGVIVIMFTTGIGTNFEDLKHAGKPGFLVAFMGVVIPLVMGTGVGFAFGGQDAVKNAFIGVILTATSVSITVEALKEMGKLSTKVGNTILAAAIIDDVLGLVALTLITSFAGEQVNIFAVIIKIVLFFAVVTVLYLIVPKLFNKYIDYKKQKSLHRYPVAAFVVCLILAYIAEEVFGVADIIGAFAAGLMMGATKKAEYIASKFEPVKYLFLTPIFFASIGLKVKIPALSASTILFAVVIIVVAISSKIIGCSIGAGICKYKFSECIQIGTGMACRGEVALIVANKGLVLGLVSNDIFAAIIVMVVCCAVITPVLLKIAFKGSKDIPVQNELLDKIESKDQIEIISDSLIDRDKELKTKN